MRTQLELGVISSVAQVYTSQTRVSTTDSSSANFGCERGVARARGDQGQSLLLQKPCDLHTSSTLHSKVFALPALAANVKGLIHTALTLREPGALVKWRRAMRAEVASRLEVRVGKPSVDAQRHKRLIMRLFVSHGASASTRRSLLMLCPNGDWRAELVQHYVSVAEAEALKFEDALDYVTDGLMVALCQALPRLYARHRWVGADLATDDLSVIEACHRLLSTAYHRFCAEFAASAMQRSALLASGQRCRVFGSAQNVRFGDAQRLALGDALGRAAAEGGAHGAPGQGSEVGTPLDPAAWAKANQYHRAQGLNFCQSDPLATCILQRDLMEAPRQYIANQLKRASQDWEQRQRGLLARAIVEGRPLAGARAYRVTEVAGGEDDKLFLNQVVLLFQEQEMWRCVPPTFHTVEFRALCFSSLARLGCSFEELLASPHRKPQWKLFRLLVDPAKKGRFPSCPRLHDVPLEQTPSKAVSVARRARAHGSFGRHRGWLMGRRIRR